MKLCLKKTQAEKSQDYDEVNVSKNLHSQNGFRRKVIIFNKFLFIYNICF